MSITPTGNLPLDTEATLIDIIADAGYQPTGTIPAVGKMANTLAYYDDRGWIGARIDGDEIIFVTWEAGESARMMSTTRSGVITAEADFDLTDRGRAWFAAAIAADR